MSDEENGSGGEVVGMPTAAELQAAVDELKSRAAEDEKKIKALSKRAEKSEALVKSLEEASQRGIEHAQARISSLETSLKEAAAEIDGLRLSLAAHVSPKSLFDETKFRLIRTELARDVVEHIMKRDVPGDATVLVLEKLV